MKDYFSDLSKQNNVQKNNEEDMLAVYPQSSTSLPTSTEAFILNGAFDITKETIRCFTEYAKCKEIEKTERKRITAKLQAIEYQISVQKEVYLKSLDKHYEERNRLYDLAEKTQERALEIGDKEMLKICYNLILNIYNKSVDFNETTSALQGNLFK